MEYILKQFFLPCVFETSRDKISENAVCDCPIVQSCFAVSMFITEQDMFFNGRL